MKRTKINKKRPGWAHFFEKTSPTRWQSDSISFGVEQSSDLRRVALPLDDVLDRRRLHQEGVKAVRLLHLFDTLGVALDEDRRLGRFHEGPHPLVRWDLGVLEKKSFKIFSRFSPEQSRQLGR